MTKRWEFHPIADMFPLIEGEEFDELVEDIRLHGQKESVYLYEGKVLDGRNRVRACDSLGIEPQTMLWDQIGDPADFVWSKNGPRRHLTRSQLAMIAARRANLRPGSNQHQAEVPPNGATSISQKQAANAVGASVRSTQKAAKVLTDGTPELIQAVDNKQIPVDVAKRIADLPKSEQETAVKQIVTGVKSTAAPKPKASEKPKGLFAKAQKLIGQLVREVDAIASAQGGPSPRSRGLLELMNTVNREFLEWKRASR